MGKNLTEKCGWKYALSYVSSIGKNIIGAGGIRQSVKWWFSMNFLLKAVLQAGADVRNIYILVLYTHTHTFIS